MENLIADLRQQFEGKGIYPENIIDLLEDIEAFCLNGDRLAIDSINSELESLGWGVELIDQKIFNSLLGLVNFNRARKTGEV